MTQLDRQVTWKCPVNIAVIKYWGKRDTKRMLPTNDSLSVTLDIKDLHTKTTIRLSKDKDQFYLNNEMIDLEHEPKLKTLIALFREKRLQLEAKKPELPKLSSAPIAIASINNFPTAAGLASSASGLSCFVVCLADFFQVLDESKEGWEELSKYARLGSGSACRSLMGGFVKWQMGEREDGEDSQAVQVATKEHWPEMKALIVVAREEKKDVSSRSGMQQTVETSQLFQQRISSVVPKRIKEMENAIKERNFKTFAELTMQDSNQFHAVCLDTFPPILYLNQTSHYLMKMVHLLNGYYSEPIVAYTFDAGPNCVLYCLEKNYSWIQKLVEYLCFEAKEQFTIEEENISKSIENKLGKCQGALRLISTGVGDGPERSEEHLFNSNGELLKQ